MTEGLQTPLADVLLVCPDETVDPTGVCPKISCCARDQHAGAGQLPGTNKMPETWFLPAVFEHWPVCQQLFQRPEVVQALAGIPLMSDSAFATRFPSIDLPAPLDDTQRALASVFAHVASWSYCNSRKGGGLLPLVHGHYEALTRVITLYNSACVSRKVYAQGVTELDAANRFWLIAAHELGHALDDLGNRLDSPGRELRATVFGATLTECVQEVFMRDVVDVAVESQAARACLHASGTRFTGNLRSLRLALLTSDGGVEVNGAYNCEGE